MATTFNFHGQQGFRRIGELEDLALSGRIPGKRVSGAQRFTV